MIDWHRLIDIQYLLDPNPGYEFRYWIGLIIISGITLGAGILLSLAKQLKGQIWRDPIAQWLRWAGGLSLILLFCRYEGLPYLSIRLWWYLLALGLLLWMAWIIRNNQINRPDPKEETKRYQTFDKYLPRPKKPGAY
jgi:hypothetical protein